MHSIDATGTRAFFEVSIEEIDAIVSTELEQFDERIALIESFSQPFPTRERGSPVMDGEMDSYG